MEHYSLFDPSGSHVQEMRVESDCVDDGFMT